MDFKSSADGGGGAEFPVGLRVLLVDDDPLCLKMIDRMLKLCKYRVTACSGALVALEILREKKGGFDIVLSDVYMPDMDGFQLLELIELEMDLPVIMMSVYEGNDAVMKGVSYGACDYLIKPVSLGALKNIWQHVYRKNRKGLKDLDNSGSVVVDEIDKQQPAGDGGNASSADDSSWKIVKRKMEGDDEDELEERDDSSSLKKPRVVWSSELHDQFVAAVNLLGLDKAVPKKILEMMNNPALTRENVASHLQKYRLYLKRPHLGRADTYFPNAPDGSSFCSTTSPDGYYDMQALAASGQIPQQALMTLHSGPRTPTNFCMDLPISDQQGFFNSGAQRVNSSQLRPATVQQVNNSQTSLFYGPPASMEPRQIGQGQQMVRSCGNIGRQVSAGTPGLSSLTSSLRPSLTFSGSTRNGHSTNSFVMQMNQHTPQISLAHQQDRIQISVPRQPQQRVQLLNGFASEHNSRVSTNVGMQMVSNGISNNVSVRTGASINGVASLHGSYMNVSPDGQVPQLLYPNVQNTSIGGSSCHPQVNNTISASHTSTGIVQEAISTASGGLDALNNVASLKDGKLQNMNLSYESPQYNNDYGSSVTTNQDFDGTLNGGAARNTCTVRKQIFSITAEIGHKDVECSTLDALFDNELFPDDLMDVLVNQPESVWADGT